MALIFQNIIVPNMPLQNGSKLLSADAIRFDAVAWQLAEEIKLKGWSTWELFKTHTMGGQVAIIAAVYAVFGHDPSLIVPINASLHAFGGVLIFLLAKELASKKIVGNYTGFIAGTLFIIFPSALNWYGQLHKDGYAIAGTLLILLMWIKVIKTPKNNQEWAWIAINSCLGFFLVVMVRPYGLTLLFLVAIGAALITVLFSLFNKAYLETLKQLVFYTFIIIVLMAGISYTKEYTHRIRFVENNIPKIDNIMSTSSTSTSASASVKKWEWQRSDWMPQKLENYIAGAAKIRGQMIRSGMLVKARSIIDTDVTPDNIGEVVVYLPRALQVAALAPFPDSWLTHKSMMRLVAAAEMFIYYLCIPGLLFLLRYERKPEIWMTIYFTSVFLLILGFTIANMGTLFRVRYAYLLVVLMLGVLGWISLLDRKGILDKMTQFFRPKTGLLSSEAVLENNVKRNRKSAMGSGVYVMALTFLGFIGFFYRDILMAHFFGLGVELDAFFVALLIPMTIVTIICIPLGSTFTPIFMSATETSQQKKVQELISGVSVLVIATLFIICLIVYFIVPYLLPYIATERDIDNIKRIGELTQYALPLLFFSGTVILGNSMLNAMGKVVVTGLAQLIVPITAISAVVVFGEQYGVEAAMLGMVIGQLLNLVIVQINITRFGYSLVPKYSYLDHIPFAKFSSQYFPLIASAFFVSVAVLVNTLLAMTLPEGGVSVFNLGNKVVLLITGLVGAAISTVMLPYFSSLVAKNSIVTARRELSVFLLLLTFISVPVSVIFFVFAEQVVGLIFDKGDFLTNDIDMVARVMKYAVIQIPFFACNILLLKFATATKHVMSILLSAAIGLLINVGASLVLMKFIGVSGIALGASLSMIVSTTFLVLVLVRYRHVGVLDMITILLNWLLFITLLISVHFVSIPGVVVTIFAYLILLAGYGRSLYNDNDEMLQVS